MRKYLRVVGLLISKIRLKRKSDEHPLQPLIGAGEGSYDDFSLAKERSEMWPR